MAASSSSRGGDGDDENEPYLVGFVVAKIVGLKYYTSTLSGGERPSLVREPLNRFDSNAIAVHNSRGRHVGHIEGRTAKVLAPLLDSHLVANTLIVVPDGRSTKAGTSFYKLPCQIHLFARPAAADIVREAIDGSGLVLIDPDHIEFSLSGSAFVQEQAMKSGRDVDKLFARVGKEGGSRIEPMEPPEDVVVSDLFEHQKAALGWLVHREESCDLPPFWKEDKAGGYENVLTSQNTKQRPQPLRGGIFADDMGLGKTLTLLSLIARSKAHNVGGGKAKGSKRRKIDDVEAGSMTTLVVCPPSVFSSWVTQLEEHTNAGSLKVYMYHGQRTKDKEVLLKYDIVITTYSVLGTEFDQEGSPMNDIEWFRVILDEAHIIKNSAALQTRAVTALKALGSHRDANSEQLIGFVPAYGIFEV
ncbi:hypothetical protein D1007_29300 [Hordeum vulgare]|nr:hypothetical protein D1007_29300 [Hordeum vulgare]